MYVKRKVLDAHAACPCPRATLPSDSMPLIIILQLQEQSLERQARLQRCVLSKGLE